MAQQGVDAVLGVRGLARWLVEGARAGTRAEFVETPEQAGEWLLSQVRPGDVVLLKASRGVHLERALEFWRAQVKQLSQGEP
jgi:UDP-N-acetylmuramoyl-tripeptide--D-alanyl-D-alanine ligase